MPKNYEVFLKYIKQYWFFLLLIVIILIAFFNTIVAIVLTLICLLLYLFSYIPSLFFDNTLVKLMKNYYKIEDDRIAQELKRPLDKIRRKMYELANNQEKNEWLIVYLNKRYIFYHQETIDKFLELYNKGKSEKEILGELHEIDLQTRAEIKAIKDTLLRHQRLR